MPSIYIKTRLLSRTKTRNNKMSKEYNTTVIKMSSISEMSDDISENINSIVILLVCVKIMVKIRMGGFQIKRNLLQHMTIIIKYFFL